MSMEPSRDAPMDDPATPMRIMELPHPARHALVQALDPPTRSSWRLVCKTACEDVYYATRTLTLEEFNLFNDPYRPEPSSHASTMCPFKCPQLQQLKCMGCTSLVHLHGIATSLTTIHLIDCPNVADLSPLLACRSNLTDLALQGPFAHTPRPAALTRVLQQLTALKHLHLAGCGWQTSDVATHLPPMLKALPLLIVLDLRGHQLGLPGAEALAPVFASLPTLQVLNLGGCALGAQGTAALAQAIGGLPALHTLHLAGNELKAEGVVALAPAIHCLNSLQVLNIANNELRADGTAALAVILRGLQPPRALRELCLSYNSMGYAGMRALARVIKSLRPGLQALDVTTNKLGPRGVQVMRRAVGDTIPKLKWSDDDLNYWAPEWGLGDDSEGSDEGS